MAAASSENETIHFQQITRKQAALTFRSEFRQLKMNRNHAAVALIGNPIFYPGYMFGLDQPCIAFQIEFDRSIDSFLREFRENLAKITRVMRSLAPPTDQIQLFDLKEKRIDHFLFWVRCLLENRSQPVLNLPRITSARAKNPHSWIVILPCLEAQPSLAAIRVGLELLSIAHAPVESEESLREKISGLIAAAEPQLKHHGLIGFNSLHFLKEAHRLGIPWFRFSRGVFQLGYGKNSRLLHSSITDGTPNIAVMISKNKQQTSDVLRAAGLPVPVQAPVRSDDEAMTLAKKIGYPVVVKPADLEGGVGVGAFLKDDASVRAAYAHAARHSKNIVIEKHVDGNDFRMLVVNGEVLGVVERAPGGVTGDGKHSVRELVKMENHERSIAQDDRRFLHPILADHEAERMLSDAKMNWNDVPPAGVFVRLRGAANVASGGIPREIPVGEIHADNLILAQRAARALRLDVAGIDLLIPDIRTSWLESDAGICEVNSQPQMFTTMHAPMLRMMFTAKNGRIPVVVVLNTSTDCGFSDKIYQALLGLYPNAGLVSADAVSLGGRVITRFSSKIFDATRSLLMDTNLDAILISIADDDVLSSGWPIDRCDVLLLTGGAPVEQPEHSKRKMEKLGKAAKSLRPKLVCCDSADQVCQSARDQIEWLMDNSLSGKFVYHSTPRDKMPDHMLTCLREQRKTG